MMGHTLEASRGCGAIYDFKHAKKNWNEDFLDAWRRILLGHQHRAGS